MIKFNDVDLEDVAPVKIEDIRVSPISTTPVARQRIGYGQDFIRATGGNRTVTITFALLTENPEDRFLQLQHIIKWGKNFNSCPLVLPMFDDRMLECRCTGFPEPSYRQWWESKLRLVFTTFENPYWTAIDEVKASCGTAFSIGGTAPPLIRIERKLSSKQANQSYSFKGRTMTFSQIPAGNLVIDLNKETAEVSGTSIMKYFGVTGRFIEPRTGNINITGNGTIYYRERWL